MAESEDLPHCLSLVNSTGALPEHVTSALPAVWENLLEKLIFFVVEDQERTNGAGSIRAFGASVVVSEDFVEPLLSSPQKPLAERFYESVLAGEPVLQSDAEICASHDRDGVDVAVLHFLSVDHAAPGLPETDVMRHGMAAFLAGHGGFRLRSLLFEAQSLPAVQVLIQAGFRNVHPTSGPPYLMAKHRADTRPGIEALSQIFFTPAPRIYFTAAERRLLERALHGQKDPEISRSLQVSEDTVKKTWQNVFARAAKEFPAVFRAQAANERVRGPGRRTRLLSYLREHPEELRPWKRPGS